MKRNYTLAAGVILVLITIGGFLLFVNREQPPAGSPTDRGVCKTFEGVEHCTGDYIGLTEAEAVQKVKDAKLTHRIVARDGEMFPITEDYNEYRLNLTIENDRVTKAEFY